MASHLSFLALLALSILLVQTRQAFGSSRAAGFNDNDEFGACAAAVTIHGYKCLEFQARTDDGYILSVQRIPEGRAGGGGPNRPPVLLQHGVLVDGMTWLLNSPQESLAMILADNGFDVWISNIRGTRFSRRHVSLDAANPEYWNWTWDDLVMHDLPSVIDLVFRQTGQKLHYIGHSLGTLMALASFSEGRQVDKVKSAALLSPIAYLSHMNTPLGVVAAKAFVGEITTIFGLAEFNPKGKDEAFFDSQPWLDSDCEDDYYSVNGDFTPSRGNTPVHHSFSVGKLQVNKPAAIEGTIEDAPEPSPPDKKKRLSELFKDSLRIEQPVNEENAKVEADATNSLVVPKSTNGTPYLSGTNSGRSSEKIPNGDGKSFKSAQCCLPGLLSSRSFSERKKKTTASPAHSAG